MRIITREYIDIHVLPDCAVCKLSGRSPTEMDECPAKEFDIFGEECCPDACVYYDESEE